MALGFLLLPTVSLAKRSISRARQPMFCKHSRQTRTKLCARRSYDEEFWIPAAEAQRYASARGFSMYKVWPSSTTLNCRTLEVADEERLRPRDAQTVRKRGETFETQSRSSGIKFKGRPTPRAVITADCVTVFGIPLELSPTRSHPSSLTLTLARRPKHLASALGHCF